MNHFMLPDNGGDPSVHTRYGVHAMELLINDCMKAGGDRRRFTAKVFGGGHVLHIKENSDSVPKKNIRFVLGFLEDERIPIASQDLGGYDAREIYCYTHSGRTLLRRLPRSCDAGIEHVTREEREFLSQKQEVLVPAEDDITLF